MARNIFSLHFKFQAKKMKSATIQKNDTIKCQTKILVTMSINADNKDKAKESRVKSDGDITIL